MRKRIISLLLVIITVISLFPQVAYADVPLFGEGASTGKGGGNSAGSFWYYQVGYRISIVDKTGKVVAPVWDFLATGDGKDLKKKADDVDFAFGISAKTENLEGKSDFNAFNTMYMHEATAGTELTDWPLPLGYTDPPGDNNAYHYANGDVFKNWFMTGDAISSGSGKTLPKYTGVGTTIIRDGVEDSTTGATQEIIPGQESENLSTSNEATPEQLAYYSNAVTSSMESVWYACKESGIYTFAQALDAIAEECTDSLATLKSAGVISSAQYQVIVNDACTKMMQLANAENRNTWPKESEVQPPDGYGSTFDVGLDASSTADSLFDIAFATESGDDQQYINDKGQVSTTAAGAYAHIMELRVDGTKIFEPTDPSIELKLDKGGDPSVVQMIVDYGLYIIVEPTFWFRPAVAVKDVNDSDGDGKTTDSIAGKLADFWWYGTPTNYAQFVQAGGYSDGGYGGWYNNINNKLGAFTMHIKENPTDFISTVKSQDSAISHSLLQDKTKGYAMFYFYGGGGANIPEISTYDDTEGENPDPHPVEDPDPYTGKIPLTPGELPDKGVPLHPVDNPTIEEEEVGYSNVTRATHIVKVYQEELIDGTVKHVETTWRDELCPDVINIEHEPDYKVVEFYTAREYYDYVISEGLKKETTWYQISNSIPATDPVGRDYHKLYEYPTSPEDKEKAKAGARVAQVKLWVASDIFDPGADTSDPSKARYYNDTTLYVRLLKKETMPESHTYDYHTIPKVPGPPPSSDDPEHPWDKNSNFVNYTVVKVYEDEKEDLSVETVGVYTLPYAPPTYEIEEEGKPVGESDYYLIEWMLGKGNSLSGKVDVSGENYQNILSDANKIRYQNIQFSGDWDDVISGYSSLASGIAPERVTMWTNRDFYNLENRVLFIRLRKPYTEEVQPDGDFIIQQSQISKAIHTDDQVVGGRWGNYKFIMTIGDFRTSHTTYLNDGCCRGHKYCSTCHGHTCYHEMPGRNGDNKVEFVFTRIGAQDELEIKEGVATETEPKVYTPNGRHPKIVPSMKASGNYYTFVSDGNQENGAEYVTVLWRGTEDSGYKDRPTMALYKKADIIAKYAAMNWNVPQAMLNNASNKSKGTRNNAPIVCPLKFEFGVNEGMSDLYATSSCVTYSGSTCIDTHTLKYYATSGTSFTYNFTAQVAIRFYAGTSKPLAAEPFGGVATGTRTNSTGEHMEATVIQGKQQVKFFPYIKMTFMTNSLVLAELEEQNQTTYVQNTRYDTYVLSEHESSILPSDAIEIGWQNNKQDESLLLTSQQWSLHQRAINGGEAWNGTNQVLPGGAIYQLSTPNDRITNVKVITYQTVVDDKTRQYLSVPLTGDEYTVERVVEDHTDFINQVKTSLDSLRLVQWVNKNFDADTAWPSNWTEISNDGAVCIRGGNESLSELGLTLKTNTEDKYYMKVAGNLTDYNELNDAMRNDVGTTTSKVLTTLNLGGNEKANEGDLDIMKVNQVTTVFKVFADTAGNVYMAKMQQTGTNNIEGQINSMINSMKDLNADTMQNYSQDKFLFNKSIGWAQVESALTDADAKQIDARTKFITNIVKALTRNKGQDKTASWSKVDGKWYNEAFDGMYLVRQAVTIEVGLQYSANRASALDPALCPSNVGQSDLYTNAFLSQFCMNNKSDAEIAKDKENTWVGTFKNIDIKMPDMEGMYQSRKFYIPNANVQDLN